MTPDEPYPTLKADLAYLESVMKEPKDEASKRAGNYKRLYLRTQLVIIFGSVLAVVLGVVATTVGSQGFWTLAQSVLTFFLGALVFVIQKLRWHDWWIQQRTVAETLRGERFLFLGRAGPYAESLDPHGLLERRIVQIQRQGEVNIE